MDKKIQILVVDDEQIVLDSIRKLVRKEPYEVLGALAVQDGLDLVEKGKIDIILTDLMMPEIDGLEFMAITKKTHPGIPIIMITGYATINTALQATHLGAFDYIAKPFSKRELLGVLKRASNLVVGTDDTAISEHQPSHRPLENIKTVGDHSWMMMLDNGNVLLGVKGLFIQSIGRIETVYLPSVGDELRQGGEYLQIFSTDMRSHSIPSPLTGVIVEVNQKILDDPASALQDPYGEGWLVKLKPSRFEEERSILSL
jgi:CheY-like chemotaxis protein